METVALGPYHEVTGRTSKLPFLYDAVQIACQHIKILTVFNGENVINPILQMGKGKEILLPDFNFHGQCCQFRSLACSHLENLTEWDAEHLITIPSSFLLPQAFCVFQELFPAFCLDQPLTAQVRSFLPKVRVSKFSNSNSHTLLNKSCIFVLSVLLFTLHAFCSNRDILNTVRQREE